MEIQCKVSVIKEYDQSILASGLHTLNLVSMSFTISNATQSRPAFEMSVILGADLTYTSRVVGSGLDSLQFVYFDVKFNVFNITSTVVSSSVGSINVPVFSSLLSTVISSGYIDSGLIVPVPGLSLILGPTSSQAFGPGYSQWFTPIKYNLPANEGTPCPVIGACPLETTCCNWSTGYACCVLPGANCCSFGGCCPAGSYCVDGGCEDAFGKVFPRMSGHNVTSTDIIVLNK